MKVKFILWIICVSIISWTPACSSPPVRKTREQKNLEILKQNTLENDFAHNRDLLYEGKYAESAAFFERSKEKEAPFFLALAYLHLDRKQEARQLFENCVKLQIYPAESNFNLGLLAYDDGNEDLAAEYMRKTLKIDKNHLGANAFLGGYNFGKGLYFPAKEHFSTVTRLAPDEQEGWNGLFFSYVALKRYEDAWKLREKVNLSDEQILTDILLSGEAAGDYDEALAIAEKSGSEILDVRLEKIILLAKTGKITAAWEEAKQLLPEQHTIVIDRGDTKKMRYAIVLKEGGDAFLVCGNGKEEPLVFNADCNGIMEKTACVPYNQFLDKKGSICEK